MKREEKIKRFAKNYKVDDIPVLQARIDTMIGEGGILASFAIRQPADFYIDTRVGKLRYSKRDIQIAVDVLAQVAVNCGLDPHNLNTPNALSYRLF